MPRDHPEELLIPPSYPAVDMPRSADLVLIKREEREGQDVHLDAEDVPYGLGGLPFRVFSFLNISHKASQVITLSDPREAFIGRETSENL